MTSHEQAGNGGRLEPGEDTGAAQPGDQIPTAGPGLAESPAASERGAEAVEPQHHSQNTEHRAGEPRDGAGEDTTTASQDDHVTSQGQVVSSEEGEVPLSTGEPGISRTTRILALIRTVTQASWWTRPRLVVLLAVLLVTLACITTLFVRYLLRPTPLPDLLPVALGMEYAPHYLFSIHGVDQPVGVTYSPQVQRLYVAEGGGQRMIKAFDEDGNPLGAFSPPRTTASQRAPVYLATDSHGRVFVTDRLQKAVFVFDQEGEYLDTILDPDLTLSEYVADQTGKDMAGRAIAFNRFEPEVYYYEDPAVERTLPAPGPASWSPLGLRINGEGRALLTDVDGSRHCVREIAGEVIESISWYDFEPDYQIYGETGQDAGQLLFPNSAVADSQGRIHVVDGNNSRISVWDKHGGFLFSYGQGAAEDGLHLPRGAAIDEHDRLHVVDAVGQCVLVYDVSESEPRWLFNFGAWGLGDGEFNYPNDIALDGSGRIYVADREGNRVQVWSY